MWDEHTFVGDLDGAELRALRKRLGLSQAEVGRRMEEIVGPWVSVAACQRCVSELEGNRRRFTERQKLEALLEVLGIEKSPDRLPATPAAVLRDPRNVIEMRRYEQAVLAENSLWRRLGRKLRRKATA